MPSDVNTLKPSFRAVRAACFEAACTCLHVTNILLQLLADLVHEGEQVVAAQGGAGGRGNAYMRRPGQNRYFTNMLPLNHVHSV